MSVLDRYPYCENVVVLSKPSGTVSEVIPDDEARHSTTTKRRSYCLLREQDGGEACGSWTLQICSRRSRDARFTTGFRRLIVLNEHSLLPLNRLMKNDAHDVFL